MKTRLLLPALCLAMAMPLQAAELKPYQKEALKQLEEPRAVAARRGLEFEDVAPARLVRAEAAAATAAGKGGA